MDAEHDRLRHDSVALLRQRIYQIVAGYEDVNDANRLRLDPMLQIVADHKLGDALGSQPTLSRWENAPCARDLVRLSDMRRPGPPAPRDSARSRLHRRSHPWSTATQLLQRPYWSSNVTPDACWQHGCVQETPPAMPASCPCCCAWYRVCSPLPRREDQAARRCRFCFSTSLPVLRVLRPRVRRRHPGQLRIPRACPAAPEAVKAALSPHPSAAAQLLQFPPPCPQLAAPAPHLLQGRAHRDRNQPALPDYQLHWFRTCSAPSP